MSSEPNFAKINALVADVSQIQSSNMPRGKPAPKSIFDTDSSDEDSSEDDVNEGTPVARATAPKARRQASAVARLFDSEAACSDEDD